MTAAAASLALNQALAALEEQRSALVGGSDEALRAAGDGLARALIQLRAFGATLSQDEVTQLKQAAMSLDINAALLGRVSASNQRALTTLFEPSATYGGPGQSGLAAPSRTLRSA